MVPVVIAGNARFQCFSESINSSASQTSTIQPGTLVLKPSVLLGYDARNQRNPDWGLSQIDDSSVRGIPTNVFRSCFYLQDIQASVSATYQISDVTRAQVYLATNQSTILEINVEVVTQSGQRESYTYNVFRYTPNPNQRELQQAVETPAGVYCLNRISTLAVPSNIPERFSINSEAFVSTVDNSIFSANEIFDKAVQFTRSELWAADSSGLSMTHFTEIHDFGTGLRYRYNHQNRHCQVDDIVPVGGDVSTVDGRPNLVQMVSHAGGRK